MWLKEVYYEEETFPSAGPRLGRSADTERTTEDPESSAEAPSSAAQEEQETQGEAIEDLVIARLSTAEMQTFNILYSQTMEDFANLCNMVDSLMEIDNYSRIVPCIAETA